MEILTQTLQEFGIYLLLCMGTCFVLAGILLIFAERKMKGLNVPANADFTTTLQHTPFIIVLAIDLLDFALDFLAIPFVWVLLGRYNLQSLRGISAVEVLIPGTQIIPTLTLCWFAVNYLGIRF